ncbi:hypothetical protein PHLCEN_2v4353 [Hermanssonia centrifuga]|uniref:Uncharacterized protein n=1 Tax=Hermanssonia centrifuga TaxID=98765 RepID=A0A2R6PVE9_9APHY|nr:hypothetical protein PHLCEN_2v4353 [Hermanssonia centrifuga]
MLMEEGITGEPTLNGERLRPVNQVEPTSCLGRIFNKVAEISPEYPRPGNTEASVPPEDADPSSSDSDNSLGRRVKLSARKSRHSKNSSRLPTLKPREPDAYHGRPDVHEFHKFVDECSNYVRGYSLTEERYVSTISSFLNGKAYKYYTMMVSMDAASWSLEKFDSSILQSNSSTFSCLLTFDSFVCANVHPCIPS